MIASEMLSKMVSRVTAWRDAQRDAENDRPMPGCRCSSPFMSASTGLETMLVSEREEHGADAGRGRLRDVPRADSTSVDVEVGKA